MDVTSPIATVIPSLDGVVLEVLTRTTSPLSLTDVARIGGRGSVSGVRNALLRLTSTGLVRRVPGGYELNRDHLAAPSVITLGSLHAELLKRLRELVVPWADRVDLVGLFGSTARRDGDLNSDVDVLVVAAEDVEDLSDELIRSVEAWTGNCVQVLALTPQRLAELAAAAEPLIDELGRDLVVVLGDWPALATAR